MKGIGVPSLLLKLSLLCLLRTTTGVFSAPNVAERLHLQTRLLEWKTLPTGERVSFPEKMHRQYMQTWKRRSAEASAQQWRAKRAAIDSDSRGRKLSNSRSVASVGVTTEVNALLAFRSAILTDPTGALTNWTLENEASHCSTWKGVTCDELGQVTGIELRDLGLNGSISPLIGDLAHLESLNLSVSSLWGAIPSSLVRCQNLLTLDLSHNFLGGQVPAELFKLPKLEILWLSNNSISGRLPEMVEANGCQSLTVLWIDENEISGTLPSSLSECQNLKVVSLSKNQLTGSIPAALGDLHQLQQLWLFMNDFSGPIPSELGSLTKLRRLFLSSNRLSGDIPPSLGTLSELLELDLRWNNLTGPIPPSLGNCTSLEQLTLGYNNLTGTIPRELGNLSNITVFGLAYNWQLTGPVPGILSKCSKLRVLYLGGCGFTSVSPEIWSMENLEQIALFSNRLTGILPMEVGNCTSLIWLDVSANGLNGTISDDLGGCLALKSFNFSNNYFSGGIPKFLGNFSNLETLDLSNNALNDDAVALSSLNQCRKLETLLVGQTNIYGSLPVDFTKWPSLKYFSVTGNKLTGGIPLSFGGINSSLALADFSENKFTGRFPAQVDGSHLSELRVLLFSHNEIEGSIPSWFGNLKSLQMLDLSFNQLTGSVPPNFGNLDGYKVQIDDSSRSSRAVFSLNQRVNLSSAGDTVTYSYILQATTFMDLSSNALQGEIPEGLAELVGMKYLYLSNNRFDGNLWAGVRNLKALETLDVSQNNLSGSLPPALPSSLSTFKVFLNNFSGAIPSGSQYNTFPSLYYLPGNPGLCGNVIERSCAGQNVDSRGALDSLDNPIRVSDYISFPAFGIGAAVGFCIVAMTALVWARARAFLFGAAKRRRASAKVQPAYGLFRPRF